MIKKTIYINFSALHVTNTFDLWKDIKRLTKINEVFLLNKHTIVKKIGHKRNFNKRQYRASISRR